MNGTETITETIVITSNEQAREMVKMGILDVRHQDIGLALNHLEIEANIQCEDIYVRKGFQGDITAWNINAKNIRAKNIKARTISAMNINANTLVAEYVKAGDVFVEFDILLSGEIDSRYIQAKGIEAREIHTGNLHIVLNTKARTIVANHISAGRIDAEIISYHGVCWAHWAINCTTIEGRGNVNKHFVLDGKLVVDGVEVQC